MKKIVYMVSDQDILKLKHAQLHKKPTRVLNSIQGRIIIKSSFLITGLKYKGNVQKALQ